MKLLRLIKVVETYNVVHIGKKSIRWISCSEWSETRRCFIAIAFWLCFRIYHQEQMELNGMHQLLVCPY